MEDHHDWIIFIDVTWKATKLWVDYYLYLSVGASVCPGKTNLAKFAKITSHILISLPGY